MGRRGYDEKDSHWFRQEAIETLRQANIDSVYLINRGYNFNGSITFISNRYLFSNRQREALKRAICSSTQLLKRQEKELPMEKMKDGPIFIDGFNLLITLEVALSGGTLIVGNDGCIRDLAGLRGTYKLIDETEVAIQLIGDWLNRYDVPSVIFYLDAPVSNSRLLKLKLLQLIPQNITVELVANADVLLMKQSRVVSTDAVILDACESYFNLSREIIKHAISEAKLIDFSTMKG